MSKILAIGLETAGICAILAGIVVEAIMQAPIGFVAISGGAAMIAVGSLVWVKIIRRQ